MSYPNKILAEFFAAQAESEMTPELADAAAKEAERINQELTKWMPRLQEAYEVYRPQAETILRKYAESCTFPFEMRYNFGDLLSDADITRDDETVWSFGDEEMEQFLRDRKDMLLEAFKPLRSEFINVLIKHWLDFSKDDGLWEFHEPIFSESLEADDIDYETFQGLFNFSYVNCAINSSDKLGGCRLDDLDHYEQCLPSEWEPLRNELPPGIACLFNPFTE